MRNCGMMVLRHEEGKKDCIIPPMRLYIPVNSFRANLKMVMNYDHGILEIISKLVRNLRLKTWYTVSYEELLGDKEKGIQDLLSWISQIDNKFVETSQVLPSHCMVNC